MEMAQLRWYHGWRLGKRGGREEQEEGAEICSGEESAAGHMVAGGRGTNGQWSGGVGHQW